jgi:pyrroloquinoline-quinone synthase
MTHARAIRPVSRQVPTAAPPRVTQAELTSCADVFAAAELLASRFDFRSHPYLVWMRESATRTEFMESQVPFRFAVEGFSRALAAVVARTTELERRRAVAENVAEEHGLMGAADHKSTYIEYLGGLGADETRLGLPPTFAVTGFVESIVNFALVHPGEEGAASLGIIERLYVDVTRELLDGIERRDFADLARQNHYCKHEKLDVGHARELLEVAEDAWATPRGRQRIATAMVLGARYFWELYSGLLPE